MLADALKLMWLSSIDIEDHSREQWKEIQIGQNKKLEINRTVFHSKLKL